MAGSERWHIGEGCGWMSSPLKFILCGIIASCICFSCDTREGKLYRVMPPQGGWPQRIPRTREYHELIQKKGEALYVAFTQGANRDYSEINIDIFTVQNYGRFSLVEIAFIFDAEKKVVKMNNDYPLEQEMSYFQADGEGLAPIAGYSTLLYYGQNGIKLNLDEIIEGEIGDRIPMILEVAYSFDTGETRKTSLEYEVAIETRPSMPSDLKYRLFPGM